MIAGDGRSPAAYKIVQRLLVVAKVEMSKCGNGWEVLECAQVAVLNANDSQSREPFQQESGRRLQLLKGNLSDRDICGLILVVTADVPFQLPNEVTHYANKVYCSIEEVLLSTIKKGNCRSKEYLTLLELSYSHSVESGGRAVVDYSIERSLIESYYDEKPSKALFMLAASFLIISICIACSGSCLGLRWRCKVFRGFWLKLCV